jgi:hypothetical protein
MQKYERAFGNAATRLSHAATKTVEDLTTGAIPDEPSFTAALVTRFRDALDDYSGLGIGWYAKVLSSHGPNTEETEFGADFLGVLRLALPDYSVVKRFLAQAKRQEAGRKLAADEWARLSNQCKKMLNHTPESFVFIYSSNGVHMIPAISVTACSRREDLHTLHPMTTGKFYTEHFRCFVGDRRIDGPTPAVLDNLRYRAGIEITAEKKASKSLEHREE